MCVTAVGLTLVAPEARRSGFEGLRWRRLVSENMVDYVGTADVMGW